MIVSELISKYNPNTYSTIVIFTEICFKMEVGPVYSPEAASDSTESIETDTNDDRKVENHVKLFRQRQLGVKFSRTYVSVSR